MYGTVAMPTLKQIETLHWIAQLGSFELAASRLGTTQSAVSKRILELEVEAASPLFDRSRRSARLTERGEEVLAIGRDMLRLEERMAGVLGAKRGFARRFRLGITELTALTWLPRLVRVIRERHPDLVLEPEVEPSATLRDRLRERKVDMIVVPDAFRDPCFAVLPVGEAENAWMCGPGLDVPRGVIPAAALGHWTVLIQGDRSGTGLLCMQWLRENGVDLRPSLSSNSLMALIGLTASGLGISHLPVASVASLLATGQLRRVRTRPALPPVPYVAMVLDGDGSAAASFLLEQVRACCDFGTSIYAGAAWKTAG